MKTFSRVTNFPAPDGGYYREYASYNASADDLLSWYAQKKMPESVPDAATFVRALKERGYFTDSEANYLKGLKRFL
jgi:hypothetical protein